MTHKVVGWEQETPVPEGYWFNSYLHVKDGRLHMDGLDLADLFLGGGQGSEALGKVMPSPLEIVFLPIISRRIDEMRYIFEDARQELAYPGRFH
jgi:arginine decarboxylase-like protein